LRSPGSLILPDSPQFFARPYTLQDRFVLGIRVHDNNRGASVLQLLLDIIATHGCPSRMRGDHGVENIEVAIYLEEVNGSGRGSFIWGR
jgi:hypothetical protein